MTKTYKAVLRSSLVMLSLLALAVVSSGVAQAQRCITQAKNVGAVRAEGITEVVADIELRCWRPASPDEGFGFEADIPDTLDIAIELNTRITNEIKDDRNVVVETEALDYESGGIDLVGDELPTSGAFVPANQTDIDADDMFGDGELSEDGTTIEWKEIAQANLNFDGTNNGFNLVVEGIRANASMVGNGEDIMANVLVGGTAVNITPIKVADVTTGLEVKADVAEGLQCSDTDDAMSTITIQEGFSDAIMSMAPTDAEDEDDVAAAFANSDSLMVTFTGIPEGVTVMVPAMVAVGMIDDPESQTTPPEQILDPAAFSLTLVHGSRTDGVEDVADGMGAVELTASGAGEVIYNVGMTDGEVNEEWVKLPVTFVWKAGGDTPAGVGSGHVDVSFSPVSNVGGDTFEDGGARLPRFVASNDPDMVVNVGDCTTTLLYPFVTNQLTFDTGLVITNTSEEAGSCTIKYNGANAPDDLTSQPIAGGAQWIDLVSRVANGFQGYITATCGFRDGYGFAFLTDGYGGTPTLAQSYLALCTAGAHCD